MGRNSKVVAKQSAPVPPVQPAAAVSAPTSSTSTSSSASANSYQNLIRTLVSIPEGDTEERTEILQKLASEYKNLVCTNKLNTLKEKYLSEELSEIQAKYDEAFAESSKTKAEHDALSTKYQRLRQLSQQLSDRTKQADAKAAVALNEEQQKRVKLTESFSASITAISAKLDSLTKRREVVVTENARLKATLKTYLDEFDGDQKEEAKPAAADGDATEGVAPTDGEEGAVKTEQAEVEGSGPLSMESVEGVSSTAPEVLAMDTLSVGEGEQPALAVEEAAPVETETVKEPTAVPRTAEQEAEDAALQAANAATMAAEEDESRLAQLRATEASLRAKSAQYAQLFDSFQAKLAGCNAGFQSKQGSIEALSKEMVALEKENAAITKKVSDSVMSTKVMMNMHSKVLAEQQKQIKVLEKYQGLIDILQKEIAQNSGK